MAKSTAPTARKSSMMERLRCLRAPLTSSPGPTSTSAKSMGATRRSAEATKAGKPSTKPQSRRRDKGLDLDHVNSKLEEFAQQHSQNDGDETTEAQGEQEDKSTSLKEERNEANLHVGDAEKEEEEEEEEVVVVVGLEVADDVKKIESEEKKDTEASPPQTATSKPSMVSLCPSIVITPPDNEPLENLETSDFQVFLQQAQVDEQARKEHIHTAIPRSKTSPSLNPFYSNNNLASPISTNTPKLAEIQEAGEGDDEEEDGAVGGKEQQQHAAANAADWTVPSSGQRTFSTVSSGSNDFAATETQPTRITASLGRHISFSEPEKIKRAESHVSAYTGRGCKSPEALKVVNKGRSIRKMLKKCLGQHQ
ncbi:unnamed protein product [Discula destructiva]